MTGVEARHFAQYVDRIGLADERQQSLARAVPVDQEHDARANGFERHVERCVVGTFELRGTEGVGMAFVERGVDFRLRGGLFRTERAQQRLEEFEPGPMQVRVVQGD